jgi:hypothetical protein
MASPAPKPSLSETLSKREVVEYLGKSKRTIETYIADGRLACEYFNGPNGKTAIFRRVIVEALKRQLDTPIFRAVPEAATDRQGFAYISPQQPDGKSESQIALVRPGAVDPFAGLAAHLARLSAAFPSPPRPKPWLTLVEAVEFSGLPQAYLLTQARAGSIRAVNVGTAKQQRWRFHRSSLAK